MRLATTETFQTSRAFSHVIAALVLIALAAPIVATLWFGITTGGGSTWQHILANRLLPYTLTTLSVLFQTGLMILLFAVPSAWLVSAYAFPGRKLFEWALILPLAVPGYVMAYAWASLLNVAGPVQSAARGLTGLSARDMWFPDLFSTTGLSFVLATTLYPYVYLTARAAFTTQSLSTLEVARSLGVSGWRLLVRIALPAAWPALIAGLALALMETAADYGAADHLGIQTLGVGIVRAWSSFGEPATAARLALGLVSIMLLLLLVARLQRGPRGGQHTSSRWTTLTRTHLSGYAAWLAPAALSAIFIVAFVVPIARLFWLSVEIGGGAWTIGEPLKNSILLAGAGTLLAFAISVAALYGSRTLLAFAPPIRLATMAVYATPGAVLGLGGLLLMQNLGVSSGGSIAVGLLLWIYTCRFASAGIEPMTAALARAPASMSLAARSLDPRPWHRFWTIDRPILMPGALAGGLILFVEILKELPATLMLRPFGWDTLAVRAHAYASDERLAEATTPALLIVLAGLGPVILLSNRLAKAGTSSS